LFLCMSATSNTTAGHEALSQWRRIAHLRLPEIVAMMQEAGNDWVTDNAQRLGASVAFFTLLSLAPLVVVVVAVAALAFGREAAEGQLAWQIQEFIGSDRAKAVQELIRAAREPATGLIATILSVGALIWGASAVVVELRDALNAIWHVSNPRGTILRTIAEFCKLRLFSIAIVLGGGVLLLISIAVSAGIAAMGRFFNSFLPIPETLLQAMTAAASFIALTMVFAAVYKILPDVDLRWGDVAIGAAVTSLLFNIGKQLIALYFGKVSFASMYGAAGSLVLLIVWVYYSAQVFFLGAEFTKIYTKRVGSHFSRKLELNANPEPTQ